MVIIFKVGALPDAFDIPEASDYGSSEDKWVRNAEIF